MSTNADKSEMTTSNDNEVARLRDENADLRQQLECAYADREDVRESLAGMLTKSENEVARFRELLNRAERSAKLWEEDALRYHRNEMYWKERAEKAEARLATAPKEPNK